MLWLNYFHQYISTLVFQLSVKLYDVIFSFFVEQQRTVAGQPKTNENILRAASHPCKLPGKNWNICVVTCLPPVH